MRRSLRVGVYGKEYAGIPEDADSMPLQIIEDCLETKVICGDYGVMCSVHYSPLNITVDVETKSIDRATFIAKKKIIEHIHDTNTPDSPIISDAELSSAFGSGNPTEVLTAVVVSKKYNMDVSAVYLNSKALKSQEVRWALYEKEVPERVRVTWSRRGTNTVS